MTTWAVFKTGGKQYKVQEGTMLSVEKLPKTSSDALVFDQILLVSKDNQLQVGKPLVAKAKIKAKLVENYKEKKVRVVKFKSKSKYLRTTGHRQQKTKLLIEKIES